MSESACPSCLEGDQLLQQVQQLQDRVRELEERLRLNSGTSSLPLSANPLHAPRPVVKKTTGRRRGGKPEHPPQLRLRVPPEQVPHVIPMVPSHCDPCHQLLSDRFLESPSTVDQGWPRVQV